jgi:hypothetical protein
LRSPAYQETGQVNNLRRSFYSFITTGHQEHDADDSQKLPEHLLRLLKALPPASLSEFLSLCEGKHDETLTIFTFRKTCNVLKRPLLKKNERDVTRRWFPKFSRQVTRRRVKSRESTGWQDLFSMVNATTVDEELNLWLDESPEAFTFL